MIGFRHYRIEKATASSINTMRHDDQNRKSTSDLQVHVESWIPALVATVPDDPLRLVRKIFLDEDLDLLPPQQEVLPCTCCCPFLDVDP